VIIVVSIIVSAVMVFALTVRVGLPLLNKLLDHQYTNLKEQSEDSLMFLLVGLEISAAAILACMNLARISSGSL